MAQKRLAPRIFETVQPFNWRGIAVPQGATVVEGHPLLKGREVLFRPFLPTFGTLADPDPEPAAEPQPEAE